MAKICQNLLGQSEGSWKFFFCPSKTCSTVWRNLKMRIFSLSKTCLDGLRESQNVNFESIQNLSRQTEGISKYKFLVRCKLFWTVWGNLNMSSFSSFKTCMDSLRESQIEIVSSVKTCPDSLRESKNINF